MPSSPKPVTIAVSIEATPRKAFATAIDWPGWSRSGKTEELAVAAVADYAPRYAVVAAEAGTVFEPGDYEVVERTGGGSGTEFGVPSSITDLDGRPVDAEEAERLARFVEAAWTVFARVAAGAPAELRKGPRGGGRDREKMIAHVAESDAYYAREIGITGKRPDPTDRPAIEAMRADMLEILGRPSDGSPLAERSWTTRYAARRIAWHAIDHAWEMEDRSDPARRRSNRSCLVSTPVICAASRTNLSNNGRRLFSIPSGDAVYVETSTGVERWPRSTDPFIGCA